MTFTLQPEQYKSTIMKSAITYPIRRRQHVEISRITNAFDKMAPETRNRKLFWENREIKRKNGGVEITRNLALGRHKMHPDRKKKTNANFRKPPNCEREIRLIVCGVTFLPRYVDGGRETWPLGCFEMNGKYLGQRAPLLGGAFRKFFHLKMVSNFFFYKTNDNC